MMRDIKTNLYGLFKILYNRYNNNLDISQDYQILVEFYRILSL